MVYFHGGAYGWGGTTDPIYDGQNFAKAHGDVVLVTCNYRLGHMSFAYFSQVKGGEDYQDINLGIRDHIAALQWIQKNIAAFGGDPSNVTIFGDSAGAWSTTALTISPKARGLFKSAVHAVELAYVFNNLENVEYSGEIDPAVASKAQESWVNFAKTGDPSISEVEWKAYDTDTRDTVVIEKDGWACVSDPSKTARELLEKAYGDEPYHVW